jgi:hypothetical protein
LKATKSKSNPSKALQPMMMIQENKKSWKKRTLRQKRKINTENKA